MDTMTATATAPSVALNLATRCDQCGAQAYTGWARPAATEGAEPLLLCAHHAREHEPALYGAGWTLVADERPALLAAEQAR